MIHSDWKRRAHDALVSIQYTYTQRPYLDIAVMDVYVVARSMASASKDKGMFRVHIPYVHGDKVHLQPARHRCRHTVSYASFLTHQVAYVAML